jgi:hypothetical protein
MGLMSLKADPQTYDKYFDIANPASLKLQNFINAIYKAKDNEK